MRRFKTVLIMGNWDIVRMSDTVINASWEYHKFENQDEMGNFLKNPNLSKCTF
jgi:hypothetical protein